MHTLPEENKRTAQKIAEQVKVNPSTVQTAKKFTEAVDKVAENLGVNPQKILSGEIKATQKEIKEISKPKIVPTVPIQSVRYVKIKIEIGKICILKELY